MSTIPRSLYNSEAWLKAVDELRVAIDKQTETGRSDTVLMQSKVDVLSKMKEEWLLQERNQRDQWDRWPN